MLQYIFMLTDNNKENFHAYHLVEFVQPGRRPKVKKIDIIATKWLKYDFTKKKCIVKYPSPPYDKDTSMDYDNYLKNLLDAPSSWQDFTVKIKGKANTIYEAFEKLKKLKEEESALTLDSDGSSGKVEQKANDTIRRQQLLNQASNIKDLYIECTPSSSYTLNDSIDLNINEYVPIDNGEKEIEANFQFKKRAIQNTVNNYNDVGVTESQKSFTLSQSSNKNKAFQEFATEMLTNIMIHISEIKNEIKDIKNEIQSMKSIQIQTVSKMGKHFVGSIESKLNEKYNYKIPFENIEDFENFNNDLQSNSELHEDVVNLLHTGFDSSLVISRSIVTMLKMFITAKVAVKYVAVKETTSKKVMRKTNFFKFDVIIKERRSSSNLQTSDKDVITALSNVLSNAGNWNKKPKK